MNTLGLLQSKRASLTLQVTRSIHDSMNRPKIELNVCIYISLEMSKIMKLFII